MTDCQNDNNDKKRGYWCLRVVYTLCQCLESDGRNFLAAIVLFRTRNLGQLFFDISKKKLCKPIISGISKWQLLKITLKFLF
jgi:hypothetical protein